LQRGKQLYVFCGLVLTYFILTFLLPPNPDALQRYGLTTGQLRALNITVVLPLAAIWTSAYFGYAKLRSYCRLIAESREGAPVVTIANGLMVLSYGLPLTAIITQLLRYAAQLDPSVKGAAAIVTNYVTLLVPLVAFVLISFGARGLTDLNRQRPSRAIAHMFIILFALLGVGYTYFVLHFAFAKGGTAEHYAMPLWLVLLTLVVPYLYAWYLGLVAAFEMYLYHTGLKGVLYRRGWRLFSIGLGAVIVTQIVLQYLTTLSAQLNKLSLTAIMLVVYGLLILMAIGYILVASGAKKLQKIEEV